MKINFAFFLIMFAAKLATYVFTKLDPSRAQVIDKQTLEVGNDIPYFKISSLNNKRKLFAAFHYKGIDCSL